MKLKQHIPDFCDGFDRHEVEADTIEEILACPWVESWQRDDGFYRFEISEGRYLMAVFNNGAKWWVVGYFDDATGVDLPIWKAK